MDALDGNAIAGDLYEAFGHEMTTAVATCGTCGACGPLAVFVVYERTRGDVVRCRSCGSVVLVLVAVRGFTCVHLEGLTSLEPA
jgi:DNA-directed RNA polymerase subunit RPC12/RpoP